MMGHAQYGLPSPNYNVRRRQPMPAPSRFIKYALIAFFAIVTLGLWRRSDLAPTLSAYTGTTGDSVQEHETTLHPGLPGVTEEKDDDSDESPKDALGLDIKDDSSSHAALPSSPSLPLALAAAPSASAKSSTVPKFGKITATFGEPDPPYENAIASHNLHNEIHGYPHFILREQMLRGLWSKHAYILSIIGNELAKPKDERLEWVMWHDRDTVLMNPQLPLDIFIPPAPAFDHIHMLVTNDRNGLNNGVFLCRVSGASFKFFASALSIREYQPEIQLKYTEQSGMEEVIKRENWNSAVAYVPQRWFNGFPPTKKTLKQGKASASRPGSLLIHFASNRDGLRPERMAHWGAIAQNRTAEWDKPVEQTGYPKEIAEYWDRLGKGESQQSIIDDIEVRVWD